MKLKYEYSGSCRSRRANANRSTRIAIEQLALITLYEVVPMLNADPTEFSSHLLGETINGSHTIVASIIPTREG